jgi:hypothetical protein
VIGWREEQLSWDGLGFRHRRFPFRMIGTKEFRGKRWGGIVSPDLAEFFLQGQAVASIASLQS